jgi:hypothetical protein
VHASADLQRSVAPYAIRRAPYVVCRMDRMCLIRGSYGEGIRLEMIVCRMSYVACRMSYVVCRMSYGSYGAHTVGKSP